MRRPQITKVNLSVSDQKRKRLHSEYVNGLHIRFVERRLTQLGLNPQEQLTVIEGILEILRAQVPDCDHT